MQSSILEEAMFQKVEFKTLEILRGGVIIGLPGLLIPDLEVGDHAADQHLPVEITVAAHFLG